MQPGKEHSGKLRLSETLTWTVYFIWSNKKKSHAESVSVIAEEYVPSTATQTTRRCAAFKCHHLHLFSTLVHLCRQFVFCWLAWWERGFSCSLLNSSEITKPVKRCRSCLHIQFLTAKSCTTINSRKKVPHSETSDTVVNLMWDRKICILLHKQCKQKLFVSVHK